MRRSTTGLPLIQLNAPQRRSCPAIRAWPARTASLDSLEIAVGLARSGSASAVVTGPVSKEQLYAIGFQHPGQTEFVAERCGVAPGNVVMMLAGPTLADRAGHDPCAAWRQWRSQLTSALIESRGRAALRGLQRNFGIAEPRLAVSGLNPHAGEGGALGREEIEIIEPAIAALAAEGWRVTGPLPADTMFHARARASYDAALCMYHDQALIPIKTLHFEEGVNVTLGPADRPHRARSRHRVRHRRPGSRRSRGRWPRRSAWRRKARCGAPTPLERRQRSRCARSSRATG